MRCKRCKQEGSPLHGLISRLDEQESVEVLTACAGYRYEGHQNVPERPFILFSISSFRTLENLWQKVFSRLSVPTWIVYNGSRQFIFEIDLPVNWPQRDNVILEIWKAIADRMENFK